jgi:diacylglycerol kinase (ATP)
MQRQKFSVRSRAKSFYYAGMGIRRFLRNEHNAWSHLAATLVVVTAAIWIKVSRLEAASLALAIGLVWVTEMLNTCLEQTMDLISKERHPRIRFIKDLAAGAVLMASLTALVIGLLIFIPHFL